MEGVESRSGDPPKKEGATEQFKHLKRVELTGGLLFSAAAAFFVPELVVPGLIFSAWEYGQLKAAEAWGNRKKRSQERHRKLVANQGPIPAAA